MSDWGEEKELRQKGDRGRSCGTLWAMVRTLTFTPGEIELQEGSDQERTMFTASLWG